MSLDANISTLGARVLTLKAPQLEPADLKNNAFFSKSYDDIRAAAIGGFFTALTPLSGS